MNALLAKNLLAGAGLALLLAVFWIGGSTHGGGGGTSAPDVTELDRGMTAYKAQLDSYASALKTYAETGDAQALPAAMPTLTDASTAPATTSIKTTAQSAAPNEETNP